ncbi:HNH endonuclease [Anaeromyxobacter terrae]|uniref:HNH endonuclease n=1 Tax=Anaeromyxobacter terrae TaxID=2925406 RepID=UPI001F599A91|nr:HNH endonuclease signature motif containing protein [Anaeromyxobacter sp. SG22]
MSAPVPASLDSNVLAVRLCELAGEERNVQADFLLHLEEFDRRRAFVEAGHASLWAYCLKVLHLREGAAGRRIQAMRVLRRFPRLEAPLRDARVCLSTVALLGPVLTEENVDDLLARAAYRTRAEVEHLIASIQARAAPRAGIRKLPEREPASAALPLTAPEAGGERAEPSDGAPAAPMPHASPTDAASPATRVRSERPGRRSEAVAITENHWSLRVTLDRACKEDLETLRCLLSHKIPDGDLAAVLHEAIRCAIDKHGKRKGAVAPERKTQRPAPTAAASPEATSTIPAIVRRAVWKRDGGRCAWVGPDGCGCNSRWKLELDHIRPVALGGRSTIDNLRLACRAHNLLHAERAFGREHMERFRRDPGDGPTPQERAGGAPPHVAGNLGAVRLAGRHDYAPPRARTAPRGHGGAEATALQPP